MGRGQQTRDKNYMTASEHASSAGYKDKASVAFKRLPFNYCCLSMNPADTPVMTPDGFVFDFLRIVPWIRQHGVNPVNGQKLTGKDLTRLKIHKNADGQLICPATLKALTEHSKVAAIRSTGHVYSWEALDRLCLKPKSLIDLIEGTPFTREDIVVLQDPGDESWLRAHSTAGFFHVKQGLKADGTTSAADGTVASNAGGGVIRTTDSSRAVLAELEAERARAAEVQAQARKRQREHEEEDGQGGSAAKRKPGEPTPAEAALYEAVKSRGRKAYVSLVTNLGSLNLEVHADLAPRTAHNFVQLAQRGYYNDTRFHRLIKGFMVQGGDPSGDGTGGESAWGPGQPLLDEPHPKLKHDGRGVLSMANAGPNTAGSQFFITFGPCQHLDGKHSVFGRLVGGAAVLNSIESIPSDRKAGDVPEQDIRIMQAQVVQDPFAEAQAVLDKAAAGGAPQAAAGASASAAKPTATGVGSARPAPVAGSGAGASSSAGLLAIARRAGAGGAGAKPAGAASGASGAAGASSAGVRPVGSSSASAAPPSLADALAGLGQTGTAPAAAPVGKYLAGGASVAAPSYASLPGLGVGSGVGVGVAKAAPTSMGQLLDDDLGLASMAVPGLNTGKGAGMGMFGGLPPPSRR